MKPKIAVIMVHGHAAKWLQIVINSMKNCTNVVVDFDIFVICSWPNHPSIMALTDTSLGDNIAIFNCTTLWQHGPQFKHVLGSHGTGLDELVRILAKVDHYDYIFTTETDCMAMQNGWLDWFYQYLGDDGMAGFFWIEGHNHYNINPSATLYRKDLLVEYQKEVEENKVGVVFHHTGNVSLGKVQHPPRIGVFSEVRGFANPTIRQDRELRLGVPNPGWFEPGAWLYYRSIPDYKSISVPCDHLYKYWTAYHIAPFGTYYGGLSNPLYIHYWGGTRAWDEMKHKVEDPFVKDCSGPWRDREHNLWLDTVSEKDRGIMDGIYEEMWI